MRYYPIVAAVEDVPPSVFARGEVFEFQQEDRARAIDAFRGLARSPDRSIRAGALLRVGRNLHNAGQNRLALGAYDELASMGAIPIAGVGVAADLVARHARCVLLEETKDATSLERESRALYGDLQNGRWQLTRGAYLVYAADARRWSLSRLVEDLLDFGRMDAGAREYRFQSVEPGALVRAVADEFAEKVRAHGYHIEMAAAPSAA